VEKHPEIGHLYTNLANNAFHIGSLFFDRQEFAEAIEFAEGQLVWMEEPKAAFPQLSDSFLRTEIDLRHGISLSHRGLENTAAAHQQLEHAIALAERLCDNPQQSLTMVGVLGNLYGDLANMQSQSGELGAAAMTYQRAVDWLESVLQQAPDSDAEDFVTGVYYNYALLLEKLQRDDEALELIEQALTQDVSPSYVPALAAAYRLQIRMLMAGQEPAAAIVAYEQFKRRLPELVEDHFKAALRVVADYPDAGEASDFFVTAAIDRLEQLVASGTMSVEKFERLHQLPPFAKLREHPAFPGIAATVRKLSFSN
jgi:tetratricopeptide (TPR) repeat protein